MNFNKNAKSQKLLFILAGILNIISGIIFLANPTSVRVLGAAWFGIAAVMFVAASKAKN